MLTQISLQPLDKVYLYSNFLMEEHSESWDIKIGSINNLYVLSLAAFCILLIACMNFMNLSTAMAGCRGKEIGVRKVMGSQKKDIIKQFLGESTVIAFLSLIFALMLVYQFLPVFNRLSGKQLSIQGLFNIDILPGIIGVTLFTGLISGSYPALFLSSLKSVDVFKKPVFLRRKNRLPLRKILVVLQFSIAIVVIICTTVFYRQVHYMQGRYGGFDSDNTIVALDWAFAEHREAVKNELLQHPNVIGVSHSEGPGNYFNPTSDVNWPGKNPDEELIFYTFTTDPDFAKVFKSEILAGRFFSEDKPTDESNYVLNETAAKLTGIESPVGKRCSINGKAGMIIGVLKDRSFGPPLYPVQPLVFLINYKHPRFNIKVDDAAHIPIVLDYINKIRKEFANYKPVSYRFVKDDLEKYYRKERNLSRIFGNITFLIIFLACLGLFGLSAFHAERKTKEIGIRKVFGSSVPGIVVLLTGEFIKWIVLANIIAWVVAYFISHRWLRDYVYRIDIGFDIFIFSAVLVFAIAILTVGFQAVKSARTNPVDALRYE
ncbi:ABC transporter permease [Acidobacteriota bacterium]